jgi:hypothetical protein
MYTYYHTALSPDALRRSLSPHRLRTYLSFVRTFDSALELHVWNSKLGASLFEPLQIIEIILRNRCDEELRAHFNADDWYLQFPSNPAHRDFNKYTFLRAEVATARNKLARLGKNSNHPPNVISQLMFGFWTALFERSFHRDLWHPALYNVFPTLSRQNDRRTVWDALQKVKTMRNRIAHHDAIFNRNLGLFYKEMLELADQLCPHTSDWMEHYSDFPKVWNNRPRLSSQENYGLNYAQIFSN